MDETRREYLTTEEVATMVGAKVRTLERWRQEGVGPLFTKVGHHVRYHIRDVQEWLESNRKVATK